MTIKLVLISDIHQRHNQIKIPKGDVILCAGDISFLSKSASKKKYLQVTEEFLQWYSSLDFAEKILIAGNHDMAFESDPKEFSDLCKKYGVVYLTDSGYKSVFGFNVWGSPVQPSFCDWAFNRARSEETSKNQFAYSENGRNHDFGYPIIKTHWDMIPEDTDVLITHGPPHGILDRTTYGGFNVGCEDLLEAVFRIKPKLHLFGHIHEARGKKEIGDITFVNASSVNLQYNIYPQEAEVYELEV